MTLDKWLVGLLGSAGIAITGTTISFMSHNQFTFNNNPQLPKSPEITIAVNSSAYCQKDNIDDYLVVSRIGSKDKSLITIKTGQEFWGDGFTKPDRCQKIASNYNIAKQKGATGWGVTMKNGYPIICAATNQGCLVDEKNAPVQLATFKQSVDPNPLLATLRKQTDPSYEGSDAGSISTDSTFHYFPE
jgi:hypothetical protein